MTKLEGLKIKYFSFFLDARKLQQDYVDCGMSLSLEAALKSVDSKKWASLIRWKNRNDYVMREIFDRFFYFEELQDCTGEAW